jgi:hypothetical protein
VKDQKAKELGPSSIKTLEEIIKRGMQPGKTLPLTLKKDVWAKITTDAIKNHKDPALIVSIGEENSKVRLAIVELSILEDLVNTKNTTPQSRPIDQGNGII